MPISKITATSVADNTLTTDQFSANAVHGFRNLILNGAMQVAQRGTSQTAAGYGSIDRLLLSLSGATATLSQESFTLGQTDVVGAEYYAKVDVTTGNNNCGLYYKVEAEDVLHTQGQNVTLSYWAKGTSPTNGLKVGLILVATGSPTFPSDESVTLTSTWTKYTHTFTLPSFSGTTLDASSYLEVHWDQDAGDTGTAAWELNIAQVQLEVGDVATPFEHRSYGDELVRCQRYFISCKGFGSGYGAVAMFRSVYANQAYGAVGFPTEMRATPIVTLFDGTNNTGALTEDGAAHNRGCTANNVSTRGFNKAISNGTGSGNFSQAAGQGYAIIGTYQADAEL